MVHLGEWQGHKLTVSVKPNCLTISLQKGQSSEVASFDGEGRLWTGLIDGVSYRRGLNGRVVAKWQTGPADHERRWLTPAETTALEEKFRALAAELAQAIPAGAALLSVPLEPASLSWLALAGAFGPERYQADVAAYRQVYQPVGILPPDQYMAVVLQLTEGCSFNTCTFCTFYRDRPFRIKTVEQFQSHAHAVRQYLGAGLSLRRTLFLGDANALVTPMPRLLPMLDALRDVYDIEALGGLYAFLDGFSGEKKTAQDFAALAQRGLKRVYIGLESGSPALLKFLKKPGHPQDAIQAVKAMKAGGVAVGVILLLGAGGHAYAADHVRESIEVINQMSLDADDLIYFSELIESEDMPYTQDAFRENLRPLTTPERLAQADRMENGFRFSRRGGVPHISRYDIREFVY